MRRLRNEAAASLDLSGLTVVFGITKIWLDMIRWYCPRVESETGS